MRERTVMLASLCVGHGHPGMTLPSAGPANTAGSQVSDCLTATYPVDLRRKADGGTGGKTPRHLPSRQAPSVDEVS